MPLFFNSLSLSCWSILGGGWYSHILAIWECAAGEGMVFKPFGLVKGPAIIENWSSIV